MIDVLQFHEKVMDDAMADLQVATFQLFFKLNFEQSERVYPIFKGLNSANNFVMESRKEGLTSETATQDNIFSFIRSANLPKRSKLPTDNIIEYTKGLLYRFLLERIGSFNFPSHEEKDFPPVKMSKRFLETMIPSELLIDLQILSEEPTEKDTIPYLTKFEKARLIGQRATEISMGAPPMTDVGDLTDAILIAEKELREQVIPSKICRRFPDGSTQIWCASSLASRRDDFYEFIKESLDEITIEDLYDVAIAHGYGVEAKNILLDLLTSEFGEEFKQDISEVSFLSPKEQQLFIEDVNDILIAAGVSDIDKQEPLHILGLLLPLIKTDRRLQKLLAKDFASSFFDQFKNVKWVNITGNAQTNPEDIPRHLTEDEIEDILSIVPQILSATKQNSKEARNSMIDRIRLELKELELCPSAIPELKQKIRLTFMKSRIDPGSAVGINAADSLGEQISQMTLNAFHIAGAVQNMSSGIQALSELIKAQKYRKFPNCKIVFKDRLSFEEILDKEASIVETTVADLFEEWIVDSPEKLDKYWWHQYFELPPPDPKIKVLRLFMDPIKMVERKVTMKDVVEALKKGQGKEGIPSSSMYFAHSSTAEGILDIYPNPKIIKDPVLRLRKEIKKGTSTGTSYREEFSIDVFIDNIVMPNLSNIFIKGVPHIKEIYPIKSPVWKIVANERKEQLFEKEAIPEIKEEDIQETYWIIDFDQNILSVSVVRPEHLYDFLDVLGYDIVHTNKNYAVVRYKGEDGKPSAALAEKKPSDVKTIEVNKAKQVKKNWTAEKIKKKKEGITVDEDGRWKQILDLENYHFLITKGSYLIGLMEKEEINPYYTYCNNIHVVSLSLGIEAARQFFIKELYDTFTTYGGYVNPRNILLLADFLFSQGSFLGTNYTGMASGTTGYFSLATFEKSLQTLEKGAVFAEEESLEGVSAAIAVGKPITIGTGFFNVISTPLTKTIKEKEFEDVELDDDTQKLSIAFDGDACPFDFGNEFDPVAQRNAFQGAKTVTPPERGAEEKVNIPQLSTGGIKCPTTLVTSRPSEMLEEIMDETVIGPEPKETIEKELSVEQITIPSKIKQRPLTVKPFPEKETIPTLTKSQVIELEELEIEEIAELEIDNDIPSVKFKHLPVIFVPNNS